MPGPNLLEWCSTSFSSIHKSVHQIIYSYTKSDVDTSPYLSAIQSLKGSTPASKHLDLNAIVSTLVDNAKARGEFAAANDFREVSPAMTALIRVAVGAELKLDDMIVEGLKSDDREVSKRALRANWFFAGSGQSANVEHFAKSVMPFVSLRTRGDVVKKLSHSLEGYPEKAEAFFEKFAEVYGVDASLPILKACSEGFIFERILRHRIVLPLGICEYLYEKYPNLVVRYLQLGDKRNEDNAEERSIHEIRIHDYDVFLPRLVRIHPRDFARLYEITPEKALKFGSTRAAIFLRHLKSELVEKPYVFLKLLPLKVVSKSLNKEEFDEMYGNLFPKDVHDFNLNEMVDYLEHYSHGDKFQLLKDKYRMMYEKELLDNDSFGTDRTGKKFWKLLPVSERAALATHCLEKLERKSEACDWSYLRYLPPRESLPFLKGIISNTSAAEERFELIGQMITSCSIYNSKDDLFDVLRYYYERHRNERDVWILFEQLDEEFDLKSLDNDHWSILQKIIDHAYVKGELFESHVTLVESVLEAALHNLLIHQKENKTFLNKVFEMMVECKIENSAPCWNVLKDDADLEKQCLEQFLQLIPIKYDPATHAVWKDKNDRLALTLGIVKSIDDYNGRNSRKELSRRRSTSIPERKIKIDDYPWIARLSEEFFSRTCEPGFRKNLLLKLIRVNAPELYEAKFNECCSILDIDHVLGEALALLRRDPRKILASWPDYLAEVRDKLCARDSRVRRAARRFVAATKWCHELPVKFAETCLQEIEERGSATILGILLEGEVFEKIVSPYLPKEDEAVIADHGKNTRESFEATQAIVQAAKYANPPVSFDLLSSFTQGDYTSLVEGTITSIAHRVPMEKVSNFAEKLLNKPVAAKKLGIRLLFRVSTKDQLRDFAETLWRTESNSSIREIVAKTIFEMLVKSPSEANWQLAKDCIDRLTVKDKGAIERFADVERIDLSFLGRYVATYLDKIENLYCEEDLDSELRKTCVCMVFENLEAKSTNFIEEEISKNILSRYFMDGHSLDISQVAQRFAVRSYLLPATGDKFKSRLNVIMDILKKIAESFDASHSKKPRFYPANYTIAEFYADALTEISSTCPQESVAIVESMLEVFESKLMPWQVPTAFISFNLYKEYLLSNSPRDFGTRCAKKCSILIEELSGNEVMIIDIAECLNDFMVDKVYPEIRNQELRLNVIEGFLEGDDYYGALIGAKLLSYDGAESYDERYDAIVKSLRPKQNKAVQYFLYQHLNRLKYCIDDL